MPSRYSRNRKSDSAGHNIRRTMSSATGNSSSATGNVNTIKKNAFKEYI